MKKPTIWFKYALAGLALLLCGSETCSADPGPLTLWYEQPADKWTEEALPLGNGRLGAMVFGGVEEERLQLNEETVWRGHKRDYTNPEALEALPQVRNLLFEGKNIEARKLAYEKLMGVPCKIEPYQSLGDLRLAFSNDANVSDYRRELDLDTGIAGVRYKASTASFKREVFASAVDDVIVLRISSDRPGQIDFEATLDRQEDFETKAVAPDKVVLSGCFDPEGVKFEAHLQIINEGGIVTAQGKTVSVKGADAVTLLIAGATSYQKWHKVGGDPNALCRE